MGEEPGGLELQTSALSDASDADGGPDASEDSNADTDTDSDVFSIRDPTGDDADPWCDLCPSMTTQLHRVSNMQMRATLQHCAATVHALHVGMLVHLGYEHACGFAGAMGSLKTLGQS